MVLLVENSEEQSARIEQKWYYKLQGKYKGKIACYRQNKKIEIII